MVGSSHQTRLAGLPCGTGETRQKGWKICLGKLEMTLWPSKPEKMSQAELTGSCTIGRSDRGQRDQPDSAGLRNWTEWMSHSTHIALTKEVAYVGQW